MGFYEQLAEAYGLNNLTGSSSPMAFDAEQRAKQMFQAGLGGFGRQMSFNAWNPGEQYQGPMVGEIMDKMKQEEYLRQQEIQKMLMLKQKQEFEEEMKRAQESRYEAQGDLAERRFGLSEDTLAWQKERAGQIDADSQAGRESQEKIAGMRESGRQASGFDPSVAMGLMPILNKVDTWIKVPGEEKPTREEILQLLQSKLYSEDKARRLLELLASNASPAEINEAGERRKMLEDDDLTPVQRERFEREMGVFASGNVPGTSDVLTGASAIQGGNRVVTPDYSNAGTGIWKDAAMHTEFGAPHGILPERDLLPRLIDSPTEAALDGGGLDEGSRRIDFKKLGPEDQRQINLVMPTLTRMNKVDVARDIENNEYRLPRKVVEYLRQYFGIPKE